MARKYARIFVHGHYLFREAYSFPRAKLEENCELRGTDNVQGQISEHSQSFLPNQKARNAIVGADNLLSSDDTKNSLNTPMQSDLTLVIDRKKLKPLFIIFSFFSDTLHVWKMMPFRREMLLLFLTFGVFAIKRSSSQGITGKFFLFLLYSNKK